MAQMVEHLPSKYEALLGIQFLVLKKERKRKEGRKEGRKEKNCIL
jgi:hypothetical protein